MLQQRLWNNSITADMQHVCGIQQEMMSAEVQSRSNQLNNRLMESQSAAITGLFYAPHMCASCHYKLNIAAFSTLSPHKTCTLKTPLWEFGENKNMTGIIH